MYPTLFSIPGTDASLSSFGAMMCVGFFVAHWITRRRLTDRHIDPALSMNLLVLIAFGGVAGSKLYYAIDVSLRGIGTPYSNFFQSSGMTWYGGLAGAIIASVLASRMYSFRVSDLLNAAAPAVAAGQAIGRIGCFLNGDDYGTPTSLPWGVAFPLGQPPTLETVHPTQLYEAAWLTLVAIFLPFRRDKSPTLFAEYVALNGLGRIIIEGWRLNPKLAFELTQPQWIGIFLVITGSVVWLAFRARRAKHRQLEELAQ